VIRRLLGLFVAVALLGGLVAPAYALAASPRVELCHCLMHDHCPSQHGDHPCGPDGTTSIRQCDTGAGLGITSALAPMLSAPAAAPSAPALATSLAFSRAEPLLSRASAPEPPPPKS
jgi:hypothetical protein